MKAWSNTTLNLTRHVGSFHTDVNYLALVVVV